MPFDWTAFVRTHGVPHITDGKNVKRGWTNIQCPFCGSLDKAQHMGLNPETGGWACWRDMTHRGRSVPKLIQAILGCSWAKAKELAGDWQDGGPPISWGDLGSQLAALDEDPGKARTPLVRWPAEAFKPIARRTPYFEYLLGRDFYEADILDMAAQYDLRAASYGKWAGRILMPFQGLKSIHGWQGRAVGKAELRYLSYPNSEETKKLLFNFRQAWHAKRREVLVIVEGPFDCLKVDWYGEPKGIRSVATLGTSFVDAQVSLLYGLCARYGRTLVLFDPEAESNAYALADRLSLYCPVVGSVPEGVEDPGALSPREVVKAVRTCL